MSDFLDDITYPYELAGFNVFEDKVICNTCQQVFPPKQGIIFWSQHWANCTGKNQVKNIQKIQDMPLDIQDKMDLVKKVFNIEQ